MPLVCITGGGTVAGLAEYFLQREGLLVRTLWAGSELIEEIQQLRPSLIMVDTSTSHSRGLDLCRVIRGTDSLARTPVILLAAKAAEDERILGLELGADDYITEFSSGREFVARVQAVMRRFTRQLPRSVTGLPPARFSHSFAGSPGSTIKTGDIEIDTSAMKISVRGNEIATTNLEFRLMYYLSHHRAQVFTRDQLLDAVWGAAQYVNPRSVDACVRRLRRKIEPNQARPTYLKTIRGAGYCLQAVGTQG